MSVQDTAAGTAVETLERGRTAGVGLRSVERRLNADTGHTVAVVRTVSGEGNVSGDLTARVSQDRGRSGPAPGRVVSTRVRIVGADEQRPARSFLVSLLRSFEDVVVVREAASGNDAVAAIEGTARSRIARVADAGAASASFGC